MDASYGANLAEVLNKSGFSFCTADSRQAPANHARANPGIEWFHSRARWQAILPPQLCTNARVEGIIAPTSPGECSAR